jgi:hypothetical protein
VDNARSHAGRLKDVPEPPTWADREEIAEAIAAGTFRPGDVARMARIAAEASAKIEKAELDSSDYQQELIDPLEGVRPDSVAAVNEICRAVLDAQADAKRRHDQEENDRRQSELEDEQRAHRRAAALRKAVTLKQWIDLDEATREMLLNLDPTTVPRRKFNDQKGMDIEWAMYSWNPVTGCRHDCPYCYAATSPRSSATTCPACTRRASSRRCGPATAAGEAGWRGFCQFCQFPLQGKREPDKYRATAIGALLRWRGGAGQDARAGPAMDLMPCRLSLG